MKRSPIKRSTKPIKRTELQRSTYRRLRDDEPDPIGEPLVYISGARRVQRWKIAPHSYVERHAVLERDLRTAGRVSGRGRSGGPVTYQTEFLAARPLVRRRSTGVCEAQVSERCSRQATHVHHRKMRSQSGSNDMQNLLDVCSWCHAWIHANPAASYLRALLLHSWDAESTPIRPKEHTT